jgi:hexosaminidase
MKENRFAVLDIKPIKARYVKIIATNFGKIPSGNPGAGEDSWLFCDEIQIK